MHDLQQAQAKGIGLGLTWPAHGELNGKGAARSARHLVNYRCPPPQAEETTECLVRKRGRGKWGAFSCPAALPSESAVSVRARAGAMETDAIMKERHKKQEVKGTRVAKKRLGGGFRQPHRLGWILRVINTGEGWERLSSQPDPMWRVDRPSC